jgi:hypothetical protein
MSQRFQRMCGRPATQLPNNRPLITPPPFCQTTQFEDIQEAVRIDQSIKTNPYRTITRRRYWPQLCITM